MLLARLLRLLIRLRRVQPQIGRIQALALRRSGGRLRRSVLLAGGQPILAITTTGRRSGRLRSTTVAYVRHGGAYAVGALNLGSAHDPAWSLNLRADARAWIDVAGAHLAVAAREATGEEAELLWGRFTEQLAQTRNTRRIAQRDVPVWVLQPLTTETSA